MINKSKPIFLPTMRMKIKLLVNFIRSGRIMQALIVLYFLIKTNSSSEEKSLQINPFIYMMQ
jgi:hypothetical protein